MRTEIYRKMKAAGIEVVAFKEVQETGGLYPAETWLSVEVYKDGEKIHGVFVSLEELQAIINLAGE